MEFLRNCGVFFIVSFVNIFTPFDFVSNCIIAFMPATTEIEGTAGAYFPK